ncbi:MAG TPA: hypothetical protein VJZ68_02140 [Nitrososphaera sp.]|nr:hypothetical protein [Nitrososphaera sp.]
MATSLVAILTILLSFAIHHITSIPPGPTLAVRAPGWVRDEWLDS